jgi:hypothetical protein
MKNFPPPVKHVFINRNSSGMGLVDVRKVLFSPSRTFLTDEDFKFYLNFKKITSLNIYRYLLQDWPWGSDAS